MHVLHDVSDIVEALKDVERSFHDVQVPAEPKLKSTKSGKTKPGTGVHKHISVTAQEPQDRQDRIAGRITGRARERRGGRIQELIPGGG